MCLSPHEMDSDRLQRHIDWYRKTLSNMGDREAMKPYYEARLEQFEQLLKEKADAGEMA